MPPKPPGAAQLWREVEEHLAPTFSLWSSDRVVIFYLLRASRLAGRRVVLMPARTLSRATLLSRSTVRIALRRLAARGIIRVLKRNYSGLQIEVKLPSEIPGCISSSRLPDGRSLDALDFWSSRVRRSAIYRRDGHRCFYCLRRLRPEARVIDHVIPRASAGPAHLRALRASTVGAAPSLHRAHARGGRPLRPSAHHGATATSSTFQHFNPSTFAPSSPRAQSRGGRPVSSGAPHSRRLPPSAASSHRARHNSAKTLFAAPSRRTPTPDAAPQIRGNARTPRPSTFQHSTLAPSRAPKRLAADHTLIPANLKRLAANAPYNFLNSYRNLVACCAPCNMAKRDRPAMDLLRQLYRDHRISAREFSERVHKLKLLADGKLKPLLPRRRNSP